MSKVLVLVIATVAFFLCLFIQIAFWMYYYKSLSSFKKQHKALYTPKVSVLVCAKNEEENLPKCLNSILGQEYNSFDIIVMDDYSIDNTEQVLNQYQKKYKNLFAYRPSENIVGKKLAIQEGVDFSDSEWVLMTDADCIPKSSLWIKNMISAISTQDIDLVLGYGGYKGQKTMLNMVIRYETLYIAFQYLSAALNGKTYMGVGRNMAFRKSAFLEKSPFDKNPIGPGDDDSIVQALSNKKNTSICLNLNAHTISSPNTSLLQYFKQKRRHISTVTSYKIDQKVILVLQGITHLGVFALAIAVSLLGMIKLVLALLVLRWIVMLIISQRLFPLFDEKNLIRFFPFGDIFLALFYFFQLLCMPFPKKHW